MEDPDRMYEAPGLPVPKHRGNRSSRGFVPGKGHPSIVKKWEAYGIGPVLRPNQLKAKEVKG